MNEQQRARLADISARAEGMGAEVMSFDLEHGACRWTARRANGDRAIGAVGGGEAGADIDRALDAVEKWIGGQS